MKKLLNLSNQLIKFKYNNNLITNLDDVKINL